MFENRTVLTTFCKITYDSLEMLNLYEIIRYIHLTERNAQVSPSAMASSSSIVNKVSVPGGHMPSSSGGLATVTPDSISSVQN